MGRWSKYEGSAAPKGQTAFERERAGIARTAGGIPRGLFELAKDIVKFSTDPRAAASLIPGGEKPREVVPTLAAVGPETLKSLQRTLAITPQAQLLPKGARKALGFKATPASELQRARETSFTEVGLEHLLNVLGVTAGGAKVAQVGATAAGRPALAATLQPATTPLRTGLRAAGAKVKQAAATQAEAALAGEKAGLGARVLAPLGRATEATQFKQTIRQFLRPVASAQVEGAVAPHVLAMRSAQSRLMKLDPPELQKVPWRQRRDAASALIGREIAERLQGVQLADELAGEMFPTAKKISLPDDPELQKWLGRAEDLSREDALARLQQTGITPEPAFVSRTTKKALRKAQGRGGAFERARRLERKAQGLREELVSPFEARFRTPEQTAALGAKIQKLQAQAKPEWALGERWMKKAFEHFEGIERVPEHRVPAVWQPMYRAVKDLREGINAQVDSGLLTSAESAQLLGNIPATLSELMKRAADAGINPAHISDMTPNQVRRLTYGNVDLGRPPIQEVGKTIEGRFRKTRTGQLRKLGIDEKSVETFIAQHVDIIHEAQTNALSDFTMKNFARAIPEEGIVPEAIAKAWQPWSPTQPAGNWEKVMVGGQRVAVAPQTATHMIPRQVATAIKNHEFRTPQTGLLGTADKITNAWRYLVLNLSPRWYANNILGNVFLATLEGVRPQDWARSWQALRRSRVEGQKVRGVNIAERVRPIKGAELPKDVPGAIKRSGIAQEFDSGLSRLAERLRLPREGLGRANSIVDEFARTAVLMKSLRKGMNLEDAVSQSLKALVDYSDLSTLERSVVRRLVPFWSWQKGMLKLTARLPADHPLRAVVLQKISSVMGGYTEEERRTFPDYLFAGIPLSGGRQLATRGMNPFQDSASILTPDGIVQSLNPVFDIPIRSIFNVPEAGFAERVTVSPIGIAEPDVNIRDALRSLFEDLPAVKALFGELPERRQFIGLTIREREQIEKAIARTARAREEQARKATAQPRDQQTGGGRWSKYVNQ